jgi:hypothetical protein
MKKRRGCAQWVVLGIVAILLIAWLASLGGGDNQGAQRSAPTIAAPAIVAATATPSATNTPAPPTPTPMPTDTPTPTPSPTPCDCSANVYNCDDFTHNMYEAQGCAPHAH